MHPEPERIEELLLKYIHEDLSEEEQMELEAYVQGSPELTKLYEELKRDPFLTGDMKIFSHIPLRVPTARFGRWEIMSPEMEKQSTGAAKTVRLLHLTRRNAIACAMAICLALAGYFILRPTYQPNRQDIAYRYKNTIHAGTNRAVLTLDDGRSVVLEGNSGKLVAEQGNVRIKKLPDGTILYEAAPLAGRPGPGKYHTVTTPQGGQYRVILPDSSIVQLNAASSLRFPAVFGKQKRVVEINGEAYFDVRHEEGRPFHVILPGDARVEVLGTAFNVKAYKDEPVIKTTLTRGAIKMRSGSREILLKPGEQALIPVTQPEKIRLQTGINLHAETSWKDGYFQFEDMELEDIMRQIARWYDVEVVYRDHINKRFNVLRLSRSVPLSRLLELLEMTGHVKFLIEGRRVTVMR